MNKVTMHSVTSTNLLNLTNCWLSPQGEVFVWDDEMNGDAFHEELALCIIRDLQGFDTYNDAWSWIHDLEDSPSYAYVWLEDNGWIRLHGFRVESSRARWIINGTMTFQQKMKIRQWCKINEVSWEKAVDNA